MLYAAAQHPPPLHEFDAQEDVAQQPSPGITAAQSPDVDVDWSAT